MRRQINTHRFPRIRGDVPSTSIRRPPEPWFSPHTRGCSGSFFRLLRRPGVFPAYAGMFRIMSGGRWRCRGFPRIRGDVPTKGELGLNLLPFSPHTRGCSDGRRRAGCYSCVFPAYAGMFLSDRRRIPLRDSFPRIRGDVPKLRRAGIQATLVFPHTRGCSDRKASEIQTSLVFPAYAGMFLPRQPARQCEMGFPRIRGDVPEARPAMRKILLK